MGAGASIVMAVATLCGIGWGEWAANNLVKVEPAGGAVAGFSSLGPVLPVFLFFTGFPSFVLHLIRWYRETPYLCCFSL